MSDTIVPDTWVCIRLNPDCPGEPHKPHHPREDTVRALVTAVGKPGEPGVFVLFKGGWLESRGPLSPGGRGIGRCYRPDELEPTPEPP